MAMPSAFLQTLKRAHEELLQLPQGHRTAAYLLLEAAARGITYNMGNEGTEAVNLECMHIIDQCVQKYGVELYRARARSRDDGTERLQRVLIACALMLEHTSEGKRGRRHQLTAQEEHRATVCLGCLKTHFNALKSAQNTDDDPVDCIERGVQMLSGFSHGTFFALVASICGQYAECHSRELQQLSLSTIRSLIDATPVADVWRTYFPGVFTIAYKVCRNVSRAGSNSLIEAIRLVTLLTQIVINDEVNEHLLRPMDAFTRMVHKLQEQNTEGTLEQSEVSVIANASYHSSAVLDTRSITQTVPTTAWMKELLENLEAHLIPTLLALSSATSPCRVRIEVLGGLQLLLSSCSAFLKPICHKILAVAVEQLADELETVSCSAETAISQFFVCASNEVSSVVRSNMLCDLQTSMEQCCTSAVSGSDQIVCRLANLSTGYVHILREEIAVLLTVQLPRILSQLMKLFTFDEMCAHVEAVEAKSFAAQDQRSVCVEYYRVHYKYLHKSHTRDAVKKLCVSLGIYSDPTILLEMVSFKLSKVPSSAPKAIAWATKRLSLLRLAQCVLVGVRLQTVQGTMMDTLGRLQDPENVEGLYISQQPRPTAVYAVKSFCRSLVQSRTWSVLDEFGPMNSSSFQPRYILTKTNEWIEATLVEMVATCGSVLQREFDSELMHILFPVVVKAASSCTIVSQAAVATLTRIAAYCNYENTAELLLKNMDYLVDNVCLLMRSTAQANRKLPKIVGAVLQHARSSEQHAGSTVTLLREVAFESTKNIDNQHHLMTADDIVGMLQLLREIASYAGGAKDSLRTDTVASALPTQHVTDAVLECLRTAFLRRQQSLPQSDDAVENEHEPELALDENNEPNVAHKLVLELLDRCVYFLSYKDRRVQVLVLETMTAAMRCLRSSTRVLLPAVHKHWPPVMARLREETQCSNAEGHPSLLLPALLDYVTILSQICGDFLSLKFRDELWPLLRQMLDALVRADGNTITRRTLARTDLLVVRPKENEVSISEAHGDREIKQAQHATHSVLAKTHRAVLHTLRSFALSPPCAEYVLPAIPSIVMRVLPLLQSHNNETVQVACRSLLCALLALDRDFLWCVAASIHNFAVVRKPADSDIPDAMEMWRVVCSDPRVVNERTRSSTLDFSACASSRALRDAEQALRVYCADASMVRHMSVLLCEEASLQPTLQFYHKMQLL